MKSTAPRRRLDGPQTPRTPRGKGKRVATKQRSLNLRVTPAIAGLLAVASAGVGTVAVGGVTDGGALSDGAYQTLSQNYVGADLSGTNAVDISRDFDRQLIQEQSDRQAEQIEVARQNLEQQIESYSEELANQWVVPVAGYRLTARFGQSSGLWSSGRHTGLDFAGPSGSTIVSIASGTVKSAGYEGAYGNKTVIVLEDGTEIWYAHQSRIAVSPGDTVRPGDTIGYTGSTGKVTGPHLHLEVRPGGGGPVDPVAAFGDHNVSL